MARHIASPSRSARVRRWATWGFAVVAVVGIAFIAVAVAMNANGQVLHIAPSASALADPSTGASTAPGPASSPIVAPPETSAAPSSPAAPSTPPAPAWAKFVPSEADLKRADSLTVLVNKRSPLNPATYAPTNLVAMSDIGVPSMNGHSLRKEAADAIKVMFADGKAAGFDFDMTSGYRDYDLQTELYTGYVAQLGQAAADATSAKPGSSEHQTGLAADITAPSQSDCFITACFADSEPGKWLAANAWKYGFILRYPKGQTQITGYEFEPWHYRFIGVDTAKAYHESGAKTYEEFVGAPPAPDYR